MKELIGEIMQFGSALPKGVDLEQFRVFLGQPYFIYSREPNSIKIAVPKFMTNFRPGWIIGETDSHYMYEINFWTKWLGVEWPKEFQMPPEISQMLADRPKIPIRVEGEFLEAWPMPKSEVLERYGEYLVVGDGYGRGGYHRIKRGHVFDLLVLLLKDGYMPFRPDPVRKIDQRNPDTNIELRPYQKGAFEEFLKYGAIGVFWPPAGGKTYLGLYAMASLEGRHLVVVPTRTLQEQWMESVRNLTGMDLGEIDVVTYYSHDMFDKKYTLTLFDECQHLPADVFSSLATVNTKYRIGLSASPYREDNRTEYIFALTGKPVGVDWNELIAQGILQYPEVTVYLVQNPEHKTRVLQELLEESRQGKTIVFSDRIKQGKALSEQFGIPFVYGDTTNRMGTIENNNIVLLSRVGDEGISLPNLERVIQFSFFGGSRRQEMQRAGRLMHHQKEYGDETSHIVLMTQAEYRKYSRRFHGIIERGMNLKVVQKQYAA